MRLLPKDPYDASMSQAHVSMRSHKMRRKAYAIEHKHMVEDMGYKGTPPHLKAAERAEKAMPPRYQKQVHRLLEEYHGNWNKLLDMKLPRRQTRMINAVINAHYVDLAIRHDELMYRNMF